MILTSAVQELVEPTAQLYGGRETRRSRGGRAHAYEISKMKKVCVVVCDGEYLRVARGTSTSSKYWNSFRTLLRLFLA